MDNKKKLTVVIAVFAVVCVFALLVFTGVLGGNAIIGSEETTEPDNFYDSGEYTSALKATCSSRLPYLATDIENIYATISPLGEVKFYAFENNMFKAVEADGKYTVTVKMSEQNVTAEISYIKKDGVIAGYGLYTGKTSSFDLYPYVLFRLKNYGENYSKASSSGCILLADITEDDFYSNDKIYEEAFNFRYSDSSCTRILSEANRTVGIDGTKRSDYTLINDTVIDGSAKQFLFFSGRQYAEADTRVDLMRSGGSGNNVDNIIVARDVIGYWAKYVDGDIMYIAEDENGYVTVYKYDTSAEEAEAVKTFDGVTRNSVLVSGDYIYIVSANKLYSIVEDKEISLGYAKAEAFRADMFLVNGDSFILRGYAENRYPVAIVADAASGSVSAVYSDEFFRSVVNPVIAGERIIFTVQNEADFIAYIF